MSRHFVKSTGRKRTAKLMGCSLLGLNCFLVLLALLLVPNNSQAFQRDDAVVAQNRGPWGQVIVRSSAGISKPWHATVTGRVPNGTRGSIKQGPKRRNGLLWYEVNWKTQNGDFMGWSAETVTVDGCKVISPAEQAIRRDKIVSKLFKMSKWQAANNTLHDYNGYGCDPGRECGYRGGHSGLDALSTDEDKKTFYSLTAGELIKAGKDNSNTIAVYDRVTNRTTIYLHASAVKVFLPQDREINVGDPLGVQGRKGNATGDHVHIEVRIGKAFSGSCGARIGLPRDGRPPNMDPIPYLYRWATGARKKQFLPWDVSQNGKVNWYDRFLVNRNRGTDLPKYDVNSDGTVDQKDVDEVNEHLGDPPPAAPTSFTHNQIENITIRAGQVYIGDTIASRETVLLLLDSAREADDGSLTSKRRIVILENILASMTPNKTILLTNYPNPFNPETWIPYQLANDVDVALTISDVKGQVVRTLALGNQLAGIYQDKSRAAYWDGRNAFGEPVASGVYFYTLTAGDFTATRKMLIRK